MVEVTREKDMTRVMGPALPFPPSPLNLREIALLKGVSSEEDVFRALLSIGFTEYYHPLMELEQSSFIVGRALFHEPYEAGQIMLSLYYTLCDLKGKPIDEESKRILWYKRLGERDQDIGGVLIYAKMWDTKPNLGRINLDGYEYAAFSIVGEALLRNISVTKAKEMELQERAFRYNTQLPGLELVFLDPNQERVPEIAEIFGVVSNFIREHEKELQEAVAYVWTASPAGLLSESLLEHEYLSHLNEASTIINSAANHYYELADGIVVNQLRPQLVERLGSEVPSAQLEDLCLS